MDQKQRLYRSQKNKIIAGVCGGLAEFLNTDVTIVRLAWLLLTLLGGSGIIIYILAYFIIPVEPLTTGGKEQEMKSSSTITMIFGILFITIGIILLLDNLYIFSFHRWWNISWEYVFPTLLILSGIYLFTRKTQESIPQKSSDLPPEVEEINREQTTDAGTSAGTSRKSKELRRSITDKKLLGICGGIGEYFDIDPTIIRISYAVFTVLSSGAGIFLYLLMYVIIPEGKLQTGKP